MAVTQYPIYTPPQGLVTNIDRFKDFCEKKYSINLDTYDKLHTFSVTRLNDFWLSFWDFAKVKCSTQPTKIYVGIDQHPPFFEDARLNFAENILLGGRDDQMAIIDMNEQNFSSPNRLTWRDLRGLVSKCAWILRTKGVHKGDNVVVIGSNCARSLALLLAAAAVGATFASFATDLGEQTLQDRLKLLRPRLIIAELEYSYAGKAFSTSSKLESCMSALYSPGRCELIAVPSSNGLKCASQSFDDLLRSATNDHLSFEQLPFNTPLAIMFSSGTTGSPKGIIHSHGGLVVNGLKEHLLHNSLGPDDVHIHFSSIGWTLWNISIGALLCQSALVTYDGSPFHPTPERLLRAVLDCGITFFGAGPRYFTELQQRDVRPRAYATRLRSIASTGAVLTANTALWVAEAFGPVCQISMSGGTELSGAFLHGTRSLPSFPGELAVKALGLAVEVFRPDGTPVEDGESGELVCVRPFPNMPLGLLNDAKNERYHKSFFTQIPGVWTHGDFIRRNPETRGYQVLGRSDGVLNPSGVRFGSLEIYQALEDKVLAANITDSLVVGQQRLSPPFQDAVERVVLFVQRPRSRKIGTGAQQIPWDQLVELIRQRVALLLTKRHVPHFVFETPEIPYNVNGKKLEIQVKAILNQGPVALMRMKVTTDERRVLEWFGRFYDIEKMAGQTFRNTNARL